MHFASNSWWLKRHFAGRGLFQALAWQSTLRRLLLYSMSEQSNRWIAPRLRCGLGNRLFQMISTIGEAERRGMKPVLLLPRATHAEHGETEFFKELFSHIPIQESALEWKELEELPDGSIPSSNSPGPIVLKGFFQNSANFPPWGGTGPSYTSSLWPHLPSQPVIQNRWAIHFRLGDYKILPHHQLQGLKAFYGETIKTRIPPGSELLLVSDSPEALPAIQEELSSWGYSTKRIEARSAKETFLEVSQCAGGVIGSNSTFGWWMAYFCWRNTGAKSYFPDTWFQYPQRTPDILNTPFTQAVPLQGNTLLKSFCY